MSVGNKTKLFRDLCREAKDCRKCPNLAEREALLSLSNGNFRADILFLAEAPGRQGGDRTRIPFSGDQSGVNFERFIDSIKLKREDIFITNSALCNPRTETGANRKPAKTEIKNCSHFLRRTIELVDPKIIVTLGSVALEALKAIEYHQVSLKNAGACFNWNGRLLVPLFHPSPQVLASHRREREQLADYQNLASVIDRTRSSARTNKGFSREFSECE